MNSSLADGERELDPNPNPNPKDKIKLIRVYFSLYSTLESLLLTPRFTIVYGEESGHWIHCMDESVRFGNPTFNRLFDLFGEEHAVYHECRIAIKYIPEEYKPFVIIDQTPTGERITYDYEKMKMVTDTYMKKRIQFIEEQYKLGVSYNPNFFLEK
jgi:hypothetical protein